MLDMTAQRRMMVDTQIRTYDVTSSRVLEAMESVPRDAFVPAHSSELAYTDSVLTVRATSGEQRSLLQPMIVARMVQALDVQPGEDALDVAGGSGYGAAILADMGAHVVAMEDSQGLADLTRTTLDQQGISTVSVQCHAFNSPLSGQMFDAICLHGSCDVDPADLLSSLKDGGRLVVIMGSGRAGRVTLFTRSGQIVGRRIIFDASAAPLQAFSAKPGFAF
jgi:protein-L-isoaspartate(D-aspartate) O-methyltransferase